MEPKFSLEYSCSLTLQRQLYDGAPQPYVHMATSNLRNVFVAAVSFLILGTSPALACMCQGYQRSSVEDEVKYAVEGASAVFVGKVIEHEVGKGVLFERPGVNRPPEDAAKNIETQLIRFQVEEWWKMELPNEVLLITDSTREVNAEDRAPKPVAENVVELLLPGGFGWNMCMTSFEKDKIYLVYASGTADKLQYRYCTRTTTVTNAKEDLAVLGKGQMPIAGKPLLP